MQKSSYTYPKTCKKTPWNFSQKRYSVPSDPSFFDLRICSNNRRLWSARYVLCLVACLRDSVVPVEINRHIFERKVSPSKARNRFHKTCAFVNATATATKSSYLCSTQRHLEPIKPNKQSSKIILYKNTIRIYARVTCSLLAGGPSINRLFWEILHLSVSDNPLYPIFIRATHEALYSPKHPPHPRAQYPMIFFKSFYANQMWIYKLQYQRCYQDQNLEVQ